MDRAFRKQSETIPGQYDLYRIWHRIQPDGTARVFMQDHTAGKNMVRSNCDHVSVWGAEAAIKEVESNLMDDGWEYLPS